VIETILTVNDADDFVEGERVTVEYDPKNPSHARPTGGVGADLRDLGLLRRIGRRVAPRRGRAAGVARPSGRTRRQGGTDVNHARSGVHEVAVAVGTAYVWLGTEFLVALWPVGAPVSRPPEMAVAIHDDDEFPQGAVTVHGRAEPGGRVILEAGGKFFWPRRKVRRELPDTAQPLDVTTKR
jgi:hypothetical protein